MHALLVVNPSATSTTPRVLDVITHALHDRLDLDVVTTEERGHATELARRARRDGLSTVVVLGGDGTVGEVLNGLLEDGPGHDVPSVAPLPGGSANVLVRALGIPQDPVEATGGLLDALAHKREREIGLGLAEYDGRRRWFAVNAGLGLDAEIVDAMERQRAQGKPATPGRYFRTSVAQYFVHTDRRSAALTVHRPGVPPQAGVHLAVVQNTSPWTYLGPVAVTPAERASFDTRLDLFAPRSLGVPASLGHVRSMFRRAGTRSGRRLLVLHDQAEFRVTADPAVPLQVDGEGLGPASDVRFRSVPAAIRVIG